MLSWWITLYIHICSCIRTSVKHRAHKALQHKATHSKMMGWFLSRSNTELLNANETEYGSHHTVILCFNTSSRGKPSHFFDFHLYCLLMAAEHRTGLLQQARAWRRNVSIVEANVLQIIFLLKQFWLLYYLFMNHISKCIYSKSEIFSLYYGKNDYFWLVSKLPLRNLRQPLRLRCSKYHLWNNKGGEVAQTGLLHFLCQFCTRY